MDWGIFWLSVTKIVAVLIGSYILPRLASAAIFTSYYEVKKIYLGKGYNV